MSPIAPSGTGACSSFVPPGESIFISQSQFLAYLSAHPKVKKSTEEIRSGKYSVAARPAITQVTVSKMIDVFGHSISTAWKTKVSDWLANLTNLLTTDYFDPKTHKGFLCKDLENRRRTLPDNEKHWVWKKIKPTTWVSE